jgi:hypothetical protein
MNRRTQPHARRLVKGFGCILSEVFARKCLLLMKHRLCSHYKKTRLVLADRSSSGFFPVPKKGRAVSNYGSKGDEMGLHVVRRH